MKIFKTIAGVVGGATIGLLFAQKKGKDFRKDLLKDKDKMLEVLGKEFLSVGKEISEEVKKIAETEDAKELIIAAKKKFQGIAELAKKEGGNFAQEVEKYLKEVSKYTKEKAGEIEKELKPKAKKVVKKAANVATKKTKAVKKTVAKKTTLAKKTLQKTVKKAGKSLKGLVV